MKNILALLIVLALPSLMLSAVNPPALLTSHPVAVLELFTSQGCSSCPPADQLLMETTAKATAAHQSVYLSPSTSIIGTDLAGATHSATLTTLTGSGSMPGN